jgi:hypothetical protein
VDPDLEMQERPQSPEASTFKGADGMISAVRQQSDVLEDVEVEPLEIVRAAG